MLDVAIIGGGPAALTAALYLARAGRTVKVFERREFGGELNQTAQIVNYPGYSGAGRELGQKFRDQAKAAGAELEYGECSKIEPTDVGFALTIDDAMVSARGVLVATGSEPKPLGFEITPPVSYCALCDGDFARDKHAAVIGGGNAAAEEALYLAPIVKDLDLITHSALKADALLRRELERQSNITIHEQLEPTRELLDTYDYVFVFIGKTPSTACLQGLAEQTLIHKQSKLLEFDVTKELDLFDDAGFVKTGVAKHAHPHETAIPGIFAAGDVRSGMLRQVVSAAGDGAAAAVELNQFLK